MAISGLNGNSFTSSPVNSLLNDAVAKALDKPLGAADQAAQKAEASKAKNKATLDAIKEKGIYAWAQEQKLEKLKEKARQQVLESRGQSEADLAALPKDQRAAAETSIEEAIARIIKEALEKNMMSKSAENADGQAPTGPMIIDISV